MKKVLVICFLKVPLLARAAWQLQYSPKACGTLRKHFTKTFSQPDTPSVNDAEIDRSYFLALQQDQKFLQNQKLLPDAEAPVHAEAPVKTRAPVVTESHHSYFGLQKL